MPPPPFSSLSREGANSAESDNAGTTTSTCKVCQVSAQKKVILQIYQVRNCKQASREIEDGKEDIDSTLYPRPCLNNGTGFTIELKIILLSPFHQIKCK